MAVRYRRKYTPDFYSFKLSFSKAITTNSSLLIIKLMNTINIWTIQIFHRIVHPSLYSIGHRPWNNCQTTNEMLFLRERETSVSNGSAFMSNTNRFAATAFYSKISMKQIACGYNRYYTNRSTTLRTAGRFVSICRQFSLSYKSRPIKQRKLIVSHPAGYVYKGSMHGRAAYVAIIHYKT